jgi:MFS family permease
MVLSYGGKGTETGLLVIIFSLANCIGRIIFGMLSDRLKKYASRTTFLNISVIFMGACQYAFAFATLPLFYPLIVLTGLAYGGLWCMAPSFVSDRYGAKWFGVNTSIANLASTAGSYVLATAVAAAIYQHHIVGKGNKCHGAQCFQITFFITTGVCVFAFITGLVLMYRTRKMYYSK